MKIDNKLSSFFIFKSVIIILFISILSILLIHINRFKISDFILLKQIDSLIQNTDKLINIDGQLNLNIDVNFSIPNNDKWYLVLTSEDKQYKLYSIYKTYFYFPILSKLAINTGENNKWSVIKGNNKDIDWISKIDKEENIGNGRGQQHKECWALSDRNIIPSIDLSNNTESGAYTLVHKYFTQFKSHNYCDNIRIKNIKITGISNIDGYMYMIDVSILPFSYPSIREKTKMGYIHNENGWIDIVYSMNLGTGLYINSLEFMTKY